MRTSAVCVHFKPGNGAARRPGSGPLPTSDWPGASTPNSQLTATGQVMGTPSFMAPEQAPGKAVGRRADVYAVGAIIYALLTGRPPFQAANPIETLAQVVAETAPPRPAQPRGRPRPGAICLKALEKEPSHRYASAADFAADLDRFLRGDPVTARTRGLPYGVGSGRTRLRRRFG